MRTYAWQIGGLGGEIQAEDVRAALRSAFEGFLASSPAISEALTSVRLQVRDVNFQPPARPSPGKTFVAFNHQEKANPFIRALWERGYHRSDNHHVGRKVDFVLLDQAIHPSRRAWLEDFALGGTDLFFVYPHTARPNLVNDIWPESERVTAHFVSAPGHVEVMRAYGYEKPLHVIGWSLCPIERFEPRPEPRRVLFAPIHERCAKVDMDVNRAAFDRLLPLVRSGDIQLTVRYYRARGGHGLAGSGLAEYRHPGIEYTCVEALAPDWEPIDAADVVVGHQTFAWLAVARGVPTIMMAEDMPAHLIPKGEAEMYPRNWDRYCHLLAYPLDLLACPPSETLSLLRRAVASDREIAGWKERMIGEPFDEEAFVSALEGYL
jgi:hypothetical protein